ncbi:MAG: VOC family protein [Pseudomonadota bacterium]
MTLPKNRITLITLAVEDLDRAVDFYLAIGWVLEEKLEHAAFFDMQGAKFGLYKKSKHAEDIDKPFESLGNGAMALAQNFSDEKAVDKAYEEALACGALECKRPEKVFWGGYSGTFADPDGHIWEYAFNPFWELDEDGKIK